jgi:Cyclin M transmembrane N-terminal domain
MVALLEAARFEPMIHAPFLSELFTWIGIAFCITQSAIFSGLNLAIFSVSKLRLEVEAAGGNRNAALVLDLRRDTNLTLSTVLLGNVTIKVLLTLLSDSVLAGVGHLSSRHSSSPSLVILEGKRKAAGGRSWGRCQGTIFKALRQYKTTMRRSAAATAKCIQDVESPRIQFCKARTKNMPLAIDRLTTLRIWTIATFLDEPEIISHSRTFWLG